MSWLRCGSAILLAVALLGACMQSPPGASGSAVPPPTSPGAARATPPAVPAQTAGAPPAQPDVALPAEVAGALPGPLYAAIGGVGIVEVDGGTSRVVFPTKHGVVALALDPEGAVWASFHDVGTVRVKHGRVAKISPTVYRRFGFRSADDGYAVGDGIEWSVEHWNGSSWKPLRTRRDFPGRFDDNKLEDLAVGPSAVWVSSWNGLFRWAEGAWRRVPAPAGGERGPARLMTFGETLIVRDGRVFAVDGTTTRALGWPEGATIDAVNAAGLLVGSATRGSPRLVIGSVVAKGHRHGDVSVSVLDDKFVDASGRIWVATDFALLALDPMGKVKHSWEPGAWPGFEGPVQRVVVRGSGPVSLPPVASRKVYEVRGSVAVYKSGRPLAAVTVELCSNVLSCADSGYRRTAVTLADGSFVFTDVPPTELTVRVKNPVGLAECGGIFSSGGLSSFSPRRDCATGSAACSVGEISVCRPFEMPPR